MSREPVSVPYWVRGQEAAELVQIPGVPAGFEQKVVLLAGLACYTSTAFELFA